MTQDNIVKIQPKSTRHQYKGIPIRISFMPARSTWHWEITVTRSFKVENEAKSEERALKAAKKAIDNVEQP